MDDLPDDIERMFVDGPDVPAKRRRWGPPARLPCQKSPSPHGGPPIGPGWRPLIRLRGLGTPIP
jgi:hypothetical protein